MICEKVVYISDKLYNAYCKQFSHYHDPINLVPKFTDIIQFFERQGKEGEQVARLAKTHRLKIYRGE